MTSCAPLLTPLWNGAGRHLESRYPCISCVCVFLLFPALSAEKLCKTSLHCQMLHGNNQKRMVSPLWRRKCCLRNLECFCGRALSNWRNKFLASHPTHGVHSWRRRAEIVPAPLLARVEPGQGGTASSVGLPEVFTVPCSSCPPAGDKGSSSRQSQWHVWVVRGKSAISWQDGSVFIPEKMGGKSGGSNNRHSQIWGFGVEIVQTKEMVLNCHCYVCGGGRWGLRSLKMDTKESFSGHVQMITI